MFLKIQAFFTALIIMLGSIALLFRPAVPEGKSIDALINEPSVLHSVEPADKVYIVDAGRLRAEELDTFICLQGLVNREKAQLYLLMGGIHKMYLDEIGKSGVEVIKTDADGNPWTLPLLIKAFKSCIRDSGYVLYRNSEFAEGLNTACNYATAEGWLAVPEEIRDIAEDCGLVLKKDISKETYNYGFLRDFFNEYKDAFRKGIVVHVKSDQRGLRDFAVQQRYFITYSGNDTQGKNYLKKILKWSGGNSYVLGWCEAEKQFVRFISKFGCAVIPSDHSRNNSFLSAYSFDIPEQTGKGQALQADPTKHYAAIVFSDGDNSQWVQNGFTEYYKKVASFDTFPMTWTFPLIQQEVCPVSSVLAYGSAGENNCFVAGVSGSGYMNPSRFDVRCLDRFTTETAAMLYKSNMDIVSILDDKPDLFHEKMFAQSFDYYARFENIKGGLVQLDPDRYVSGKGRVWFSNDKPFLSVRLSLWYPESADGTVTAEWIEEQARIVNAYAADPASVEGYSVINVNPWSISVENLAYFVSLLDAHVELVTADQLIDLVAQNVAHKNAAPKA